ncbi:hypothetical protein OH492_09195 [Vibrio chagasii]|nr:hypothetical protein [Vibrio chagasii]
MVHLITTSSNLPVYAVDTDGDDSVKRDVVVTIPKMTFNGCKMAR